MAQIEHGTSPMERSTAAGLDDTRAALAGLDALELGGEPGIALSTRVWSALWPKFAAVGIALLFWQAVVWSGWKPQYVLPGPGAVFTELRNLVGTSEFWTAVGTTMKRAAIGFTIAIILGSALAIAVSLSSILRRAFGSFITGLQTMPSIVWFPLAILMFKLTESAILFVVVLGAAPAIANGLITGVDHVPPLLVRAGTVLGARRFTLFRSVVLPAALPTYVAGLKQGWAFAWRSLMAGELLVIIAKTGALGVRLDYARSLNDTPLLIAYMIVILIIGLVVDALFNVIERRVRSTRGLAV
jgi:NitT/TauT family transport system permease protein